MNTWKDDLKKLKLDHIKATFPGFFELSGGYRMKVAPYRDTTSNELTRSIIDFIVFSGGDAQRINTTGMMRNIGGKMQWTKSGGRKGSADISAIFQGRHISIEVKIGRDQLSECQLAEKKRIEGAGGLYVVARNFPEFQYWWNLTFKTQKETV